MNFSENVPFPGHCRSLPPGYRILQLNSGHFLWVKDGATNSNGGPQEGVISWDRWWVRRCAFAHFEEDQKAPRTPTPA